MFMDQDGGNCHFLIKQAQFPLPRFHPRLDPSHGPLPVPVLQTPMRDQLLLLISRDQRQSLSLGNATKVRIVSMNMLLPLRLPFILPQHGLIK